MIREYFPIYLVIDTSKSMNKVTPGGQTRLSAAGQLPNKILQLYERKNSIGANALVSLTTFSTSAVTPIKLGHISKLRSVPTFHGDGTTNFGKLFTHLRDVIATDMERLKHHDANCDLKRPAVFIITDGRPQDPEEVRDEAFRNLCPMDKFGEPDRNAFNWFPNICMIGVAGAQQEILDRYKFHHGISYLADQSLSEDVQFDDAIEVVIQAIAGSIPDNAASTFGNMDAWRFQGEEAQNDEAD